MNVPQPIPAPAGSLLVGRIAFITGGSRGIGRAVCLACAREGADIAFNYHQQQQAAEEVQAAVTAMGRRVLALQGSVSDRDTVRHMFRTAIDTLGGLDILVSNAGITRDGLLGMMDDDAWNVVVDTNLKGTFYCCREAVRWMLRKRAGAIVNMSSLSGLMGQPGQTNYAASKGGIIAFTKSLAKEVAEKGIRVNAVAPGFIETEMIGTVADKVLEHNRANIPMRRFGAPEEVANTVVFLASDWARYITGEVINISGGLYM